MKKKVLLILGMVMLFIGGAMAQQVSGESDPFTFDTTSTPVPLSGFAIGIALLLIIGFLTRRHMLSGKKTGI